MNEVFMIRVDIQSLNGKSLDVNFHGAFKSFRSASQWMIDEGFEVYFDNDLSELFTEYTIAFTYVDKENQEEHLGFIETFLIHDQ